MLARPPPTTSSRCHGNEHLAHALHGSIYQAPALPGNKPLATALHGGMYHSLALPGIIAHALGVLQLLQLLQLLLRQLGRQ